MALVDVEKKKRSQVMTMGLANWHFLPDIDDTDILMPNER
jgi:hypothetical protein